MKSSKSPKPHKKQKSLLPPKSLPELIDRLTTVDNDALNSILLSDLTNRLKESNFELEDAIRLLFLQIQRPHAQIRLSVVRVIKYLSSEPVLSLTIREAVLVKLQDIFPFCVPTTNSEKPLPPPESAARDLKTEMLKLLLFWEKDVIPLKSLSPLAQGQLASLLRYLRTSLKQSNCAICLKSAACMLKQLEQEETQRQRNSLAADAIILRRVTAARDAFREHRQAIEENVTSLESVTKLLVPDMFEMEIEAPSTSFSSGDFREHGMLEFGEVNISISMDLANGEDDGGFLLPEVKIKLNDDNRLLCRTGNEFLNIAKDRHRPILSEFLELSRLFETNADLSSLLTVDKSDVESQRLRLDRAVSQFSAIRFLEEEGRKVDTAEPSAGNDDNQDDDDFIEVPPLSPTSINNFNLISAAPRCIDKLLDEKGDRLLSRPMFLPTDKLPWKTERRPSSLWENLESSAVAYCGGHHMTSAVSCQYVTSRQTPQEQIILTPEDPKTQMPKTSEPLNKIWKPVDTSEFEAPQLDCAETIISPSASASQSIPIPNIDAGILEQAREEGSSSVAIVEVTTKSSCSKFKRLPVAEILQPKKASKCRRRSAKLDVLRAPSYGSELLKRRILNP